MTTFAAALTFDHALPLRRGWRQRAQRGVDVRVDAEVGTVDLAPWCDTAAEAAALRLPVGELRHLARLLHRLADDHDTWRGEPAQRTMVRLAHPPLRVAG
jgi:hypothetical protein